MKKIDTRKLTVLAMFVALAYVISFYKIKVQMVSFELKDFVLIIAGFVYGPFASFLCSVVCSVTEMITVSDTGIIGCIMNILSSSSLACTASAIYKHRKTLKGAVLSLITGCIATTALMVAYNYFITPIYLNVPRETVARMILPFFLPFNLAKSTVNASVTLLLYKPIKTILKRAKLISSSEKQVETKINIFMILLSVAFVIGGIVVLVLLKAE